MIGIITYNRLDLLKLSLESLLRSDCEGIAIQDDASTDPEMLRYLESSGIARWTNARNIGADQNTFALCDRLSDLVPRFVISGSDVLYYKGWYNVLRALHDKYQSPLTGAFLGSNHMNIVKDYGDALEVESLTGPVMVESAWWKRYRCEIDPNECDISMSEVARAKGYCLFVAKNSLCQHIGVLDGLHMDGPDVGIRFVGECGELDWNKLEVPRSDGLFLGPDFTLYASGGASSLYGPGTWHSIDGSYTVNTPKWSYVFRRGSRVGMKYPVGCRVAGVEFDILESYWRT